MSCKTINIFIIHRLEVLGKTMTGFLFEEITEKSSPSPNTGYCHCLIFRARLAKSELVSMTKNKHFKLLLCSG